MSILGTNMYILGAYMYQKGTNIQPLGTKVYLLKRYSPSDSFCTFFSESVTAQNARSRLTVFVMKKRKKTL